jgi:hypothetical protein
MPTIAAPSHVKYSPGIVVVVVVVVVVVAVHQPTTK